MSWTMKIAMKAVGVGMKIRMSCTMKNCNEIRRGRYENQNEILRGGQ